MDKLSIGEDQVLVSRREWLRLTALAAAAVPAAGKVRATRPSSGNCPCANLQLPDAHAVAQATASGLDSHYYRSAAFWLLVTTGLNVTAQGTALWDSQVTQFAGLNLGGLQLPQGGNLACMRLYVEANQQAINTCRAVWHQFANSVPYHPPCPHGLAIVALSKSDNDPGT